MKKHKKVSLFMLNYDLENKKITKERLDELKSIGMIEGDWIFLPKEIKIYDEKQLLKRMRNMPGFWLKKYTKRLGFNFDFDCKCNRIIQEMDNKGSEWCIKNIRLISDFIEKQLKNKYNYNEINRQDINRIIYFCIKKSKR